ncbi:MAG: hypothetical protein AB1666_05290 [Pseudomonadota bacterium]
MLTSLFGDLGPFNEPPGRGRRRGADTPPADFAATAILESSATEVNDRGQMVDKHTRDLFVVGSPAQAIRQHLAETRAGLKTASRQITLFDPGRMWAAGVVKALSDASGQPVERLHLRRQNTLATIALIERTALPRRLEEPLKIYHTDVREAGSEAQAIPIALMESSHLTVVIVAPMSVAALDDIATRLHAAALGQLWRCPHLLFMLSTPMAAHASRIRALPWPGRLHVAVSTEPMTSASNVWNAILHTWNEVKALPSWDEMALAAADGERTYPIRVADLGGPSAAAVAPEEHRASDAAAAPAPQKGDAPLGGLDGGRLYRALNQLMQLEGMLGCCAVDATTGLVLQAERAADAPDLPLELAAATHTEVLRAHRRQAGSLGTTDRVEEIIVTQGPRHQVLRTLSAQPQVFLLAVLDKQRTNLALARFKIMEAEKSLG